MGHHISKQDQVQAIIDFISRTKMIDGATIFTKGGVILWSYSFASMGNLGGTAVLKDPLEYLIKTIFLEERLSNVASSESYYNNFRLRWKFFNELDVIFVAVYQSATEASYVEKLLDWLKQEFCSIIPGELSVPRRKDMTSLQTELLLLMRKTSDFDKRFLKVLDRCDTHLQHTIQPSPSTLPARARRGGVASDETEKKPKKGPAMWNTRKVTKQAMSALDFSNELINSQGNRYASQDQSFSDEESEDSDGDEPSTPFASRYFNLITSSIQRLSGNKVLDEDDLTDILQQFKETLMHKNVAADMVHQLVESVKVSLIGTKTESFTSVKTALRTALKDAIQRVLTQKKSIDVLKAANDAKDSGRVYSICFLGVNGVGKSTNLAKVAYYLKHKGQLKVMIAACDTFRAGAVEQLKTHARNLDVHLFEQGYGRDAAVICKNALKFAQSEGYDVVLIDTAGRMQDNEPLMRALAKLVAVNNPDLVLFVGEALVGNDATDQLLKFNRSLIDYAPINVTHPRGVDGIILTKFDTVDDKVGAALSMAYLSGQPVIFVGTGQKYTHLQTLKVNAILKALLDV